MNCCWNSAVKFCSNMIGFFMLSHYTPPLPLSKWNPPRDLPLLFFFQTRAGGSAWLARLLCELLLIRLRIYVVFFLSKAWVNRSISRFSLQGFLLLVETISLLQANCGFDMLFPSKKKLSLTSGGGIIGLFLPTTGAVGWVSRFGKDSTDSTERNLSWIRNIFIFRGTSGGLLKVHLWNIKLCFQQVYTGN